MARTSHPGYPRPAQLSESSLTAAPVRDLRIETSGKCLIPPIDMGDALLAHALPHAGRIRVGNTMTLDGSTGPHRQTQATTPGPGSWASSPESRRRMQRQGQKNTRPERELRAELTRLGYRYRLQRRPEADLRSRLDIVFVRPRVAVDVRGCFWHGCPTHGTRPKANASRWSEKLDRNIERDAATVEALTARGWLVEIVWEHEDMHEAALRVAASVDARRGVKARTQPGPRHG